MEKRKSFLKQVNYKFYKKYFNITQILSHTKATNENKEAIINEAKRKAFEEKYNEFLPNIIANINEKEWENIKIIHNAEIKTDSFFDIYTDIMIDGK